MVVRLRRFADGIVAREENETRRQYFFVTLLRRIIATLLKDVARKPKVLAVDKHGTQSGVITHSHHLNNVEEFTYLGSKITAVNQVKAAVIMETNFFASTTFNLELRKRYLWRVFKES